MGLFSIVSKLEPALFYLLLSAIPFQARKIIFQEGFFFNEWQSAAVYGTDVLLIALFLFWLLDFLKNRKNASAGKKMPASSLFLFGFFAFSALSIVNSSSRLVSLYQLLKLGEFILFYFYIKNYASRKFNFNYSLLALIAGGLAQALIAIFQFLTQSSLGLGLLGESVINKEITGVASFYNAVGEKIVRAYGTTPHPNILAAFFLLSLFSLYLLYFRFDKYKVSDRAFFFAYLVILLGFFYTFSRTVILFWALGVFFLLLAWFRRKREWHREKVVYLVGITIFISLFFTVVYWPNIVSRLKLSGDDQAVSFRVYYAEESVKSGPNLLGHGIGNFAGWLQESNPNLPRYMYQPVHNIYLLVYSETGIFGFICFLFFIFFLLRDFLRSEVRYKTGLLVLFGSFLLIGFFDHFFLMLQQGRLMFWLVAGMLAQRMTMG